MNYSIRELSEMAGGRARTLRYYDEIGLLKPLYVNEAGYRYYGQNEVALLQQILFYRQRGLDLKSIRNIIYQDDFDIMKALREHLRELEEQRKHMDFLIHTVEQTIASMKGEYKMTDKEKFEAFKKNLVEENEERYGKEVREKYGDEEADASNRKMMNMSEEEWNEFKWLEIEIKKCLKEGVQKEIEPDSEEAGRIVRLHKDWLCRTWKDYSAEAHKGIAAMYMADERFKAYYNEEISGCAELLSKAVEYWAERM